MIRKWVFLVIVVIVNGGASVSASDYAELVAIYRDVLTATTPPVVEGLPDSSAEALAANRRAYEELRRRFDIVNPSTWATAQRIDYLLVRSLLDGWDFEHRILRSPSRNPGHYLNGILGIPYLELPASSTRVDALREQLRAIPGVMERAKTQLTELSPVLSRLTVRNLELDVGVFHGEPRRGVPGVIGWFRDLEERLGRHHPELLADAARARAALESYRDWLRRSPGDADVAAGLGRESLDWYLRNVRLSPFDARDVVAFTTQELRRLQAMLAWERHRNRHLPELEPVDSPEEYDRRKQDAEADIRRFMIEQDLLSVPDDIPDLTAARAQSYPWFERPTGHRNYWEEIQHRDPRPDFLHTVIPGHAFDDHVRRGPTPIRDDFRDRDGREGWGLYVEEMFLRTGFLDERPRTRELVLAFLIGRAARCVVNMKLQLNELTIEDGVRFLADNVPFNSEEGYRIDAELYDMLRAPTYSMNWYWGKLQIDRLVAERSRELGSAFDLRAFHDEFLMSGAIPITLVRWEMTGRDDEIETLWDPGATLSPE